MTIMCCTTKTTRWLNFYSNWNNNQRLQCTIVRHGGHKCAHWCESSTPRLSFHYSTAIRHNMNIALRLYVHSHDSSAYFFCACVYHYSLLIIEKCEIRADPPSASICIAITFWFGDNYLIISSMLFTLRTSHLCTIANRCLRGSVAFTTNLSGRKIQRATRSERKKCVFGRLRILRILNKGHSVCVSARSRPLGVRSQ